MQEIGDSLLYKIIIFDSFYLNCFSCPEHYITDRSLAVTIKVLWLPLLWKAKGFYEYWKNIIIETNLGVIAGLSKNYDISVQQ